MKSASLISLLFASLVISASCQINATRAAGPGPSLAPGPLENLPTLLDAAPTPTQNPAVSSASRTPGLLNTEASTPTVVPASSTTPASTPASVAAITPSPAVATSTPSAAITTPGAATTTPFVATPTPAAATATPAAATATPAAATPTPAAATPTPAAATPTPVASSPTPAVANSTLAAATPSASATPAADNLTPGTTRAPAATTPSQTSVAPTPTVAPAPVPTLTTAAAPSPVATSRSPTPTLATPNATATPAPTKTPAAPGLTPVAGPPVPASASGYYNATVQAANAAGTLNADQAKEFGDQIATLFGNSGVHTQVQVTGQSVASNGRTGRKLSQTQSTVPTNITLDINIMFGPVSTSQALLCQSLLTNLSVDLGNTQVVLIVLVVVPVPVYIPAPPVAQPVNQPQLPATASVTIPDAAPAPGVGGNIGSQDLAGGSTVAQYGNNNTVNINNTVNNVNNTSVTNVINNIINQAIANPGTPGSASTATATVDVNGIQVNATASAGGAVAGVADTVATPPTYITQPAPTTPPPPSPPPAPPAPTPECGWQPQCRIYTRDTLCCQNEGILTPFQGAQIEILCTHPVRFAITCLAVSGPTNVSAASVYNNDYGYNYNFRTNINWLAQTNGYLGKVTVDVEPARLNAARSECSLNLQTPCMFNGSLVTTMPPVRPLDFSVIDQSSFYQNYVGFPPTNAIGQFSYAWKDDAYPGQCLEQPTLTVSPSFFLGSWPTQEGFAYPCNATATYEAVKAQCPGCTTQYPSGVAGIAPN